MAFELQHIKKKEADMASVHRLEKRTYVNRAGDKVVDPKDKEARKGGAVLLGIPGDEIALEKAEALGLLKKSKKKEDAE